MLRGVFRDEVPIFSTSGSFQSPPVVFIWLIRSNTPPASAPTATAETAETAETATAENAALPHAADLAVQNAAVGTVLPQTPDAGRSYVDETLFIGDSNTARYLLYADDTGQAFTTLNNNIGVVSMGAGAITTLKC